MFTSRTLLEGKWPIAGLAVLSVAGGLWCWLAATISLALLAFTIAFFRDPEAVAPADDWVIVAPATGKIVEITPVSETTMVAIFLSVFDVHVQRAPIAGTIKRVQYHAGKFLDARHPDAPAVNESRLIEMETADGYRVVVKQIAGLIARRVVSWKKPGESVARGERIGLVRFGSRVDMWVPKEAEIVVKVGERVKGGSSVLARWPAKPVAGKWDGMSTADRDANLTAAGKRA